MGAWFSPWMVTPGLLGLGAAAIAVPILIHLLNRRKFKVVEWAAMDFLLEADRRNRRRVRLENLLLLLLRCLAVLLAGLLLARPFLPTQLTAGLLDTQEFERIVLLDDSLSMESRSGNRASWERALDSLESMIRGLAEDSSEDTLTLLTTSRPQERVFNAVRVNADSAEELIEGLRALMPADEPAPLEAALAELEQRFAAQPKNVNRVVYVVTDLRERDWRSQEPPAEGEQHPLAVLARVSREVNGCFVVDCGATETDNLAIVEIRPEGTLVAGVASRFEVTVANFGDRDVRDVRLTFAAGDAAPQSAEISSVPAGGRVTTPFTFSFVPEGLDSPRPGEAPPGVRVVAECTVQGGEVIDRLGVDNQRFYAARVFRGIPVLLVDGDPSAAFGRSETFYLGPSLSPPGDALSGIAVETVTDTEFETASLAGKQVIFLCNVPRLSEAAVRRLEDWVRAGGGLVIFPGDQVEEQAFNDLLFREGKGLSPIRLDGLRGDETEQTWAFFQLEDPNHPAMRIFAGANNPFLQRVKIFRWWGAAAPAEQQPAPPAVLARLTDEDDSPAVVEKPFGAGRVAAFAVPADADWTTWPDDPSYLIALQELTRFLAGDQSAGGMLQAGEPLAQPVDLSQHRLEAELLGPAGDPTRVQAQPPEDAAAPDGAGSGGPSAAPAAVEGGTPAADPADASGPQAPVWRIAYDDVHRRGFYELVLTRTDEGQDRWLFAANVDPSEGDLRRVETAGFKKGLGEGAPVVLVAAEEIASQGVQGSQNELWLLALALLGGVLATEQTLGWWFGRKR